ncbi:hypothetical protein KC221_30620, partial [Mycobacterium tuberculosis]|nr:hypothetical protein [Mycobacterium tuberculosis]
TNVRTEILAGVTTFLTMAYIIFVNPSILGDAGVPKDAVFVATCLAPIGVGDARRGEPEGDPGSCGRGCQWTGRNARR